MCFAFRAQHAFLHVGSGNISEVVFHGVAVLPRGAYISFLSFECNRLDGKYALTVSAVHAQLATPKNSLTRHSLTHSYTAGMQV